MMGWDLSDSRISSIRNADQIEGYQAFANLI